MIRSFSKDLVMANTANSGIIKFRFNLKMSSPINEEHFLPIEKWRIIFHKMNLIGEYKTTNVGFGNLSKRLLVGEEPFVITGTQTGHYPNLNGMQYCKVTKCNMTKLIIEAVGPIAPSSESLTHHAVYSKNPKINFVFHIHHIQLWNYMLKNKFPNTPEDIDHRSQAMIEAAKKCTQENEVGIFAISSSEGSVIAYGKNAEDAGKLILETLKKSR